MTTLSNMKYILIALFLCFFAIPVMAQNANPIEVTADNALEWDRANQTFTARGNAMITQGQSTLTAPTIQADYDEGETMTIRQVTAGPNATLKQPTETLTAANLVADFNEGVLSTVTATDNVVLKTDNEILYGNQGIYDAANRLITITGDVRIERGQNILVGNTATFDLNTSLSTMTADPQSGGRVKATFFGKAAE